MISSLDLNRRLDALVESDADAVQALADEVAEAGREIVRTVVDAWAEGLQPTACAFVCTHLQELACAELLLRSTVTPAPGVRAQMLEQVVSQHLLFREYLLATLEPTSTAAYLLIRRLVRPLPEEADQFSRSEAEFIGLGPIEGEAELTRWAESRTWTSLFVQPPPPDPEAAG